MSAKLPKEFKPKSSKTRRPSTAAISTVASTSFHEPHSESHHHRLTERQNRIIHTGQNNEGSELPFCSDPQNASKPEPSGFFHRVYEVYRSNTRHNRKQVNPGGGFAGVTDISSLSAIEMSQNLYERSMKPIKNQLGSIQGYIDDREMTHLRPPPPIDSKERIYYKSGPLGRMFYDAQFKRDLYPLKGKWWITSRMVTFKGEDRKLQIVTSLAELTFHLIFVLLITLVAYWRFSIAAGHENTSLEGAFIEIHFFSPSQQRIKLYEIRTHEEVFWYLERIFVTELFRNDPHTGGPNKEDRGLMYEHYTLERIQIQMIHVREDTCNIHPLFKDVYAVCYDYYSTENEMKSQYRGYYAGQIWTWMEDDYAKPAFSGQFGTYDSGGYSRFISTADLSTAQTQIQELKHDVWIRRSSRLILARCTLYNTNINYFAHITIAFEFPPTGGVFPSHDFRIARLLPYNITKDFLMMGIQATLVFLVIIYTLEALIEMVYFKKLYFTFFWSWVDLAIIGLCFHCIFLQLFFAYESQFTVFEELSKGYITSAPYLNLIQKQEAFNTSLAFAVFLCWLRILKYLDFIETVANLSYILYWNTGNILSFFYFAFMMWIGFALLGYAWFGRQLTEFQTFATACMTLLRALFGEANFTRMIEEHYILGPLYISLYYLITVYNTMYLLLIIWLSSFDLHSLINAQQITSLDVMKIGLYNVCTWFRPEIYEVQTSSVTIAEIVDLLKKHNFHSEEINYFLHKYKISPNKAYTKKEMEKILSAITQHEFTPRDESKTQETYLKILREKLIEARRLHDDVSVLKPKVRECLAHPVFLDVDILITRLYYIEAVAERAALFVASFLTEMETALFQMLDLSDDDDEPDEYSF